MTDAEFEKGPWRLCWLDTETTSLNAPRVVQLAFAVSDEPGEVAAQLFKPPVPIEYEAMATHHITNERVAEEATFAELRPGIQAILDRCVVVAHNAPFDVGALKNEGVEVAHWIDTLKVARRLWPEWPSHQLQYLRYRLHVEIDAGPAHDAAADVRVLRAVFDRILQEVILRKPGTTKGEALRLMHRWSTEPAVLHLCTFGKHKGETWEDVARNDLNYLFWLDKQDPDPDLRATITHWLNHYKHQIGRRQ